MVPEFDVNGNLEPGEDEEDQEETHECMEALAYMLEERSILGSCVGLKEMEGGWLSCDEPELQERILRVLLPSLEKLEDYYSREAQEVLTRVVAEVEAPHLREFSLRNPLLFREIANKPAFFGALRDLYIGIDDFPLRSLSMADVNRLASALETGAWPHMDRISLGALALDGGLQMIIEGLTKRRSAKPLLQLNIWRGMNEAVVAALADGFEEGSFLQLQGLAIYDLDFYGAVRLAEVLQEGCAPGLLKLNLSKSKIQAEGAGALVFAILTACPAMRTLILPANIKEEERGAINGNLLVGNRQDTLVVNYSNH
jgi:hypothetical protein